jgi:hypothetical protein
MALYRQSEASAAGLSAKPASSVFDDDNDAHGPRKEQLRWFQRESGVT